MPCWLIQGVTDVADLAVVLPAWLILVAGLAVAGWHQAAKAWFGVTAAVLGVMLLLKLMLLGTGALAWAGIRSPSGHTASAALLGGGLLGLATAGRAPLPGWVGACAAALAGLLIGTGKILLGDHTPGEVALALPVGVLGGTALMQWQGRRPRGIRIAPVLAVAALTVAMLFGTHLQAESAIQRVAALLRARPEARAMFQPLPTLPALDEGRPDRAPPVAGCACCRAHPARLTGAAVPGSRRLAPAALLPSAKAANSFPCSIT